MNLELPVSTLKAAALCVRPTRSTRRHRCGVAIDVRSTHATISATDGHVMFLAKVAAAEETPLRFIIPAKALHQALAGAEKGTSTVRLCSTDDYKRITLHQTEIRPDPEQPWTFPTSRTIPDYATGVPACYDPELVALITRAVALHNGGEEPGRTWFIMNGPNDPAVVMGTDPRCIGLVMPTREAVTPPDAYRGFSLSVY